MATLPDSQKALWEKNNSYGLAGYLTYSVLELISEYSAAKLMHVQSSYTYGNSIRRVF